MVGDNIKKFMDRLDYTETDIAEKLTKELGINYSQPTVSKMINNKRKISPEEIVALAKILKTSYAQLLK